MKLQDQTAKLALTHRLRRIEGQLRGVESMLSEERDCTEILQQMSAIRSAMQSASAAFLEEYVSGCLLNCAVEERPERERMVRELVGLMSKTG
jgi:DNA-binding FrmR family transcriptional regulator